MRLSKIEIISFKRIKSVELDLADINILVGANSSGKSSIIQAVHFACCAMRQAPSVKKSTSTINIQELDYLPSNDYKNLGYKSIWGNKKGTPSSKVNLTFTDKDNDGSSEVVASCQLRSARNAGISVSGSIPSDLLSTLRSKDVVFSAYTPGISGIPNEEEKKSKKVILKSCSYGDSNIILRNVLLLLKEDKIENINHIERWISEIIGPIKISVEHDNESDLFINCNIEINGDIRPIELIGTGYLQLIQIFSYILLFNPGILLIDEPDTHLHPNVQEKLVGVLAGVAQERPMRVLMTTHSPFIVRGAPPSTKVYWVNEGNIASENRNEVELALGWGVFGKKIIIISEDKDTSLLKKIVSQWPEIDKFVAFMPGNGSRNIPTPSQATEISETLGGKYKILVHRDRDSLTDDEVNKLIKKYKDKGVSIWFTDESDIEAYFCQKGFLQDLLVCTPKQADQYIQTIFNKNKIDIHRQFESQRVAHNRELYGAGGSPVNDDVWREIQMRPLGGAKGKYIFSQLKNIIPSSVFCENAVLNHNIQVEIATSLRNVLEQLLTN